MHSLGVAKVVWDVKICRPGDFSALTCRMPSSALKANPAKGDSVCSLLYLWWVWCSSLPPATQGPQAAMVAMQLVDLQERATCARWCNNVTSQCTFTRGKAHASMAQCHGKIRISFTHMSALMLCDPRYIHPDAVQLVACFDQHKKPRQARKSA